MAKVIELESGSDPVETPIDPMEQAKQNTEDMIQGLMKKAYILGLSTGMKTMCGSILEKMNQNKNLNPQKQLILLRQWCNHNLAINKEAEQNQENQQTTIENNTIKKENNINDEGTD